MLFEYIRYGKMYSSVYLIYKPFIRFSLTMQYVRVRFIFSEDKTMNKKDKKKEKEVYEKPDLEVVEFELEDSIAASGNFGPDTICGGEI